ncbi:hypothetical protein D3C87_1822160 [compost metagenome]
MDARLPDAEHVGGELGTQAMAAERPEGHAEKAADAGKDEEEPIHLDSPIPW